MATFTLYKNNAIRLVVNTGTGAIMEGQTVAENEFYEDMAEPGVMHAHFAQPWVNGETAFIVFNSDVSATYYLYICDDDLVVLQKRTFLIDGEDYNRTINITNEGRMYISRENVSVDAILTAWEAKSEPIVFVEDAKKITAFNNVDTSLAYYYGSSESRLGTFRFFVPGKIVRAKQVQGEKNETYTDSRGQLHHILVGSFKQKTLITDPLPEYMHDMLVFALQHHRFEVDGIIYTQIKYEQEDDDEYSLTPATITLQLNNSYIENIYQV